ncbi:hypothetical protein EV143_106267 [Flavobacterium chryseum]|uniref:hypothetical protein n=1 Tax=Flavobacterium sp. P3160 TaxID=2512113 RepID=UPI00105C2C74|nr:hypothetical protein [Flavobacterium sp. P3160]TDO73324.1 hypothetical protein EV143_106267 [Flavobacterium sp. P3160]
MKNASNSIFVLFFITISCQNNTGIEKETAALLEPDLYRKTEAIQEKLTSNMDSEIYLRHSFLTEISNKNYGINIHQAPALKSNNYFKYSFMTGDTLPLGSGRNSNANNYLYLQKVNKNSSKIASGKNSNTEIYSVIVIRDNKIISTLEIDLKNKELLSQLDVRKDDVVNLKRKDISNKNTTWKSYRITGNGKMVELQ